MPQHIQSARRYLCSLLILLISSSPIQMVKADSSQSLSGNYCPAADILLITAEDLTSSLELLMRSRAAQARGALAEMANSLYAAEATLQQAASRGAGARTALLIHSIILAKVNDNYEQLLTWFPLLHSTILTLPNDRAQSAAEDAIVRAKALMQGEGTGDPLEELRKAHHFLTCDGLYVPLQIALDEHARLVSKIYQNHRLVVAKDYDKIINSLRNAMTFIMENSKNPVQ